MAPGSSAQKKKKELEARRERKAAEALAAAAATTATPEVATHVLVPIPTLGDTNSTETGDIGGGTCSGSGVADDAPPISIRTKRGPVEPGNLFTNSLCTFWYVNVHFDTYMYI